MLVFRKILLCNKLYIITLITVLLITIYRINIPKESLYNSSSTSFTGIVTKIIKKEEYQTIYLKSKETILITIPSSNSIHLGDKITCYGEFQKINKNTTPNIYDYQEYCYERNIFYQIKVKSYTIKQNQSIYYFIKEKLYNHFQYNPYLLTFLLGNKSYIKEEVKTSYQENGISHLFHLSQISD